MNLSPPLGVLAGVTRPIIRDKICIFLKHLYIGNIHILGILLGDFLHLEGVFLVLQSLLFVGVFPDVLLVKEQLVTFFDKFRLTLKGDLCQTNDVFTRE